MIRSPWSVCAFSFVIALSLMTSGPTLATEKAPAADLKPQIPVACKDIDLRNAEPGVKCTTTIGTIYERVLRANFGEAWKGPDGLIWSDQVGKDTQYNAIERCNDIGGTLPSQEDFMRGGVNGFGEVLPHGETFSWSSSLHQRRPDYAYVNSGMTDTGSDEMDFYFSRTFIVEFRCIGQ